MNKLASLLGIVAGIFSKNDSPNLGPEMDDERIGPWKSEIREERLRKLRKESGRHFVRRHQTYLR